MRPDQRGLASALIALEKSWLGQKGIFVIHLCPFNYILSVSAIFFSRSR